RCAARHAGRGSAEAAIGGQRQPRAVRGGDGLVDPRAATGGHGRNRGATVDRLAGAGRLRRVRGVTGLSSGDLHRVRRIGSASSPATPIPAHCLRTFHTAWPSWLEGVCMMKRGVRFVLSVDVMIREDSQVQALENVKTGDQGSPTLWQIIKGSGTLDEKRAPLGLKVRWHEFNSSLLS